MCVGSLCCKPFCAALATKAPQKLSVGLGDIRDGLANLLATKSLKNGVRLCSLLKSLVRVWWVQPAVKREYLNKLATVLGTN